MDAIVIDTCAKLKIKRERKSLEKFLSYEYSKHTIYGSLEQVPVVWVCLKVPIVLKSRTSLSAIMSSIYKLTLQIPSSIMSSKVFIKNFECLKLVCLMKKSFHLGGDCSWWWWKKNKNTANKDGVWDMDYSRPVR